MQAPASLRAVQSAGHTAPSHPTATGRWPESGRLEYLVETYGNGRFRRRRARRRKIDYTYFLHYAEGSLCRFC